MRRTNLCISVGCSAVSGLDTEERKRDDVQSSSLLPNRRSFLKLTGAVGAAGLATGTAAGEAVEDVVKGTDLELPAEGERPMVRVIGTGGTIASTQEAAEGSGYDVSQRAQAIIESVPILTEFVEITFEQVAQKGSSSLLVEDYANVARAARRAEDDGAAGVIVTHGTDAIEEDAYFNDLVLDLDIPVAFVGAQRPGDAVSADGPGNLLTAVRMITREEFHLEDEPSGVYVVLNDTIHAARDVTKTNTTKLETFDSGPPGPVAVFTDIELLLYRPPGSYSGNLSNADLDTVSDKTVPIVSTGAGAEAYVTEQAIAGEYDVDGIAVLATGAGGGTAPAVSDASERAIDAGIPVVKATRVFWGPLDEEYGPLEGRSAKDCRPVTMESLPVWKSRLHLMLALTVTEDLDEIAETVVGYGKPAYPPSTL